MDNVDALVLQIKSQMNQITYAYYFLMTISSIFLFYFLYRCWKGDI